MDAKKVKGLLQLGTVKKIIDFFMEPLKRENEALNACLKEVGEKRDKALAKRAQFKPGKTYLTSWSEDDRYVDDRFYQKKLTECYDKNTRSRKAMGLP
ncbi:MAG TPA: hypothetical protein HA252_00680 [Candidatus Diapherotrites archaeon]|uniref:Uncharacterized protein n=1 Tax=Candidatus Iainarchaeum sp. TaxID=3101447 RepID=A0A7J4JF19_9ARCH|nr:hypothetical protein [Candidatus Diapherotrites archaeon]HIH15904.1 hypothetical protein [Candidatus Diapherotrites archaeon]